MVKKQGFTLIELLVVIAIIGILSSVVLASLNTARTRAKDNAAGAALSGLRAQAEIAADGGSYEDICEDDGVIRILNNAISNSSATDLTPGGACEADATSWAAAVPLSSGHFCVDSTGYSGVQGADKDGTSCAAATP